MTSDDSLIDYESLSQQAMRGVIRAVLKKTADEGLPGDHHFHISFDTQMQGVTLSKRLHERYPKEMTIVLQHRYWDLFVKDDHFEVKLTFDSIPERLVVPFSAIKVFFDPSVRYGLQFEGTDGDGQSLEQAMAAFEDDTRDQSEDIEPAPIAHTNHSSPSRKGHRQRSKASDQAIENEANSPLMKGQPEKLRSAKNAFESGTESPADDVPENSEEDRETHGAEIVSLDAFRKK